MLIPYKIHKHLCSTLLEVQNNNKKTRRKQTKLNPRGEEKRQKKKMARVRAAQFASFAILWLKLL